jgi:3-oxoacyl-[acyl-carrier-protein] synthase II
MALRDAGVQPTDVEYINAHGSSTPLNDPTETDAIKRVYGEHAYRVPISSTKGYYGHALGASGAFEAAICALAIARGWIPPTVGLQAPDAACDLDFMPGTGRSIAPRVVVSNSFGFGGINAALVFRRV